MPHKGGEGSGTLDDHKDEDIHISFGVLEEWRFDKFVVSHLPRVDREVSLTWIIRYLYWYKQCNQNPRYFIPSYRIDAST